MTRRISLLSFLALSSLVARGFLISHHDRLGFRSTSFSLLAATDKNAETNATHVSSDITEGKQGYRFGDFSRAILKRTTSRVNDLTGKDTYQFGDLSRWMDQQAKSGINKITGQDEYAFGDLTRWVDQQAKAKVQNYTGKEGYEFGDISREVVRRVWSGEYELQDVFLALRVLVSAGVSLTPVASALPSPVILELLNLGIMQDISGRVMKELGKSLDERFKLALTGNSQYQLGDITKRELQKGITAFIGKEKYEFGDISRRIAALADQQSKMEMNKIKGLEIEEKTAKDLVDWDKRFIQQQK